MIKKPRGRGGHSPRWAAKPEIIIIIIIIIIITTYIYYEQTYATIHGWRKVDTKGAERMPQKIKRM
jgi:uncharacterized membrane protein